MISLQGPRNDHQDAGAQLTWSRLGIRMDQGPEHRHAGKVSLIVSRESRTIPSSAQIVRDQKLTGGSATVYGMALFATIGVPGSSFAPALERVVRGRRPVVFAI
ncbi:hypothetical protein B5K08_26260 [Rhizobium leguminosarum bv. trifolii]|uniref:Uncharacterized protein n=1 Tax=Rhizobium leguminosarum bv. trifolii TaxID=386 RepID=A0A3E1B5N4_RHILT|nr:hypothetical protein B5K08_26260 [Rhizobium leguminosarum bv. trifolii]RFB86106.1 hypothetical protein B5K10_24975 [Rhizobium leguminosarum bv. trifolii]